MAEELTFHLADFEGPLELLLTLVQKHKMDLHNIPILELIDQYTRTVAADTGADPETASAFIEMAAHLVEMKSYLLLPRSEEGERMKQELTGQLIEYDQCRRMAGALRAKGEQAPGLRPETAGSGAGQHLRPLPFAAGAGGLAGRRWRAGNAAVVRQPTQQQFEPLVSAPVVSVNSRVVYILRQLIGGSARKLGQLFSRRQSRSTHVATFLALLELVRGGRVTLGPDGAMTMRRGRLDRTKENE